MKRVLITGALGFVGRHCLEPLLSNGYEVHAVSSKVQENQTSKVIWHCVDLLALRRVEDLMATVQPTHLLHFAWYTTPGKYETSPENLQWVQSSLTLLQSFANQGGQRVVMAGTCAEYDWNNTICKEDVTSLFPATFYGTCKHALQIMLESFSKQNRLSSAWGRLFHLYGPYEQTDRLVSSVVLALLKGNPAHCSLGNQIRDLLFVKDAADAFVTILENDLTGPVNIASGRPVRIKDVVLKIASRLNGNDLVKLGTQPKKEIDPDFLVADVSRLFKETGWSPKVNLDQGLDETIDWWKTNLPALSL